MIIAPYILPLKLVCREENCVLKMNNSENIIMYVRSPGSLHDSFRRQTNWTRACSSVANYLY